MTEQVFLIGAATAAHQVEGNNIYSDCWRMEHLKHSAFKEPSDDAVDHYNRYEEDIRLLAEAGANAYRFSIEWARIEPEEGKFSEQELRHYEAVIDCCARYGLTPVVTLHHFSSPAWLIRRGGWGKEYVVSAFARYARFVTQRLGSKLPYICTINEANMGYQLGKIAADMSKASKKEGGVQVGVELDMKKLLLGMLEQGLAFRVNPFGINSFLSPRTQQQELFVMQAHRAAVEAIREVSPSSRVGLTLSLFDYQSEPGGEETAARLWQEDFGFYLPYFRDDDFLGVQNYSRKLVNPDGSHDAEHRPVTQMGYEDYPAALGHVLRTVARDYGGDLIVTENGIATADDSRRCEFIREAFRGVRACVADGLPVKGYFYWSLLDNFEWQAGYDKTFGLIAVDRHTHTRSPKKSLQVLGELAKETFV